MQSTSAANRNTLLCKSSEWRFQILSFFVLIMLYHLDLLLRLYYYIFLCTVYLIYPQAILYCSISPLLKCKDYNNCVCNVNKRGTGSLVKEA